MFLTSGFGARSFFLIESQKGWALGSNLIGTVQPLLCSATVCQQELANEDFVTTDEYQ